MNNIYWPHRDYKPSMRLFDLLMAITGGALVGIVFLKLAHFLLVSQLTH